MPRLPGTDGRFQRTGGPVHGPDLPTPTSRASRFWAHRQGPGQCHGSSGRFLSSLLSLFTCPSSKGGTRKHTGDGETLECSQGGC